MINFKLCALNIACASLCLLVDSGAVMAQEVSPPVAAPEAKPSQQQLDAKLAVRIVQPREFCQRLTNAMTTMGGQIRNDRRDALRIGGKASAAIISQLRNGTMMPYLDAQSFKASAVPEADRKWFSLSEVLVASMGGVPKNVIMISDLNDLKLTPQVMPGSQLIVLAKSLGDMTSEKARALAKTAQALGVQINIIWINSSRQADDLRAAQGLAFMASLTGGAFLDLSIDNACGQT